MRFSLFCFEYSMRLLELESRGYLAADTEFAAPGFQQPAKLNRDLHAMHQRQHSRHKRRGIKDQPLLCSEDRRKVVQKDLIRIFKKQSLSSFESSESGKWKLRLSPNKTLMLIFWFIINSKTALVPVGRFPRSSEIPCPGYMAQFVKLFVFPQGISEKIFLQKNVFIQSQN